MNPARSRLLAPQNADGGWGAAPGGPSVTEPTALAVMALRGAAEPEADPEPAAATTGARP